MRCLLAIVAVAGCTPERDDPSSPAEAGCGGVGGCALVEVPTNPLAVGVELTASSARAGWVEVDGEPVTDPTSWDAGETVVLDVLHLAPGEEVEVTLVVDDEEVASWSHVPDPWLEPWPTAVVAGDRPEGLVCLNGAVGEGEHRGVTYLCSDAAGTPRWALRPPDGSGPQMSTPLRDGGHVLTLRPGLLGVVDDAGRWLRTWETTDLQGATYVHERFGVHDVIELRSGRFEGALAALTRTDDVVDGELRGANGIVVFDPTDGQVLFDWSAHGELGDDTSIDPERLSYERWGVEGPIGADWMHANALVHVIDEEGEGLLLSSRTQDWLLRLDLPSGLLRWRMGFEGDFELVDDLDDPVVQDDAGWFVHQHAPEIEVQADGRWRMLLVDNGNVRPEPAEPYSRLLELDVDLSARRVVARTLWGSADPGDPAHWYSHAQGDLDRLPDGSLLWLEGNEPRASVLSGDGGAASWSVAYPDVGTSYRAEWRSAEPRRRSR